MGARLYDNDVTLYCSHGDGSWQRVVLENVGLEELDGEKLRRYSDTDNSAARLFIPAGTPCPQAGLFMPAQQWAAAEKEQRAGRWTLQPGDAFLPGRVLHEVEKSPWELMDKGYKPYIIARIEAFLSPRFGARLAHWELTSATGLGGEAARWGY